MEIKSTAPIITGKSYFSSASTITTPTPFQSKTYSTNTAPAMSDANQPLTAVITGSLRDEVEDFKLRENINPGLEFYNADDIELKAIIRANPGIILIKDGVIIDKWHWRDLPEFKRLQQKYLVKNN